MADILSIGKIAKLSKKVKEAGQKATLAGGCFDVLHPGHVVFLEKAKKAGDVLIVLLESDQKVKQLKGDNRPVHNQKERAKVLSALQVVDYVVMLPFMATDLAYDKLIQQIKPDVIAVTSGYADANYHKRTAKAVGAQLKYVTKKIGNHSTSRILRH